MARLFIRHEPVEWELIPSATTKRSFHANAQIFKDHGLSLLNNDMDFVYVCVVDDGVCLAARAFHSYTQGANVRIDCVSFMEDPNSKLMLLKDTLLG